MIKNTPLKTDFIADLQIASSNEHIPNLLDMQQWIDAVFEHENKNQVELCIRIVEKKEIQRLNKTFRKKDNVTDVLSFPYDAPQPDSEYQLLGDMIICADYLDDKAKELEKPLQDRWAHIIIHSTLHLLGYDHVETQAANIMEKIEIDILKSLNIGNPYEY